MACHSSYLRLTSRCMASEWGEYHELSARGLLHFPKMASWQPLSITLWKTVPMLPELPDDIAALKCLLTGLYQQNAALQAEKQQMAEQLCELQTRLDYVLEQLQLSRSRQFGKRSEQAPKGSFNEAEQNQPKPEPQHHKKGRQPLPESLPREERTYTLDQPRCASCQHELHACGVEESEQLKIIPMKISVIKHRRTKYACRHCEQTTIRSQIITAPKPAQLIPRSIASPETLAAVVTAKYCDALPLYRQADILARAGLSLSRSTLADWCVRAGQALSPLLVAMRQHLLQQPVICADETGVQVLDEPERAAESKSYMWVYRSGEYQTQPVVLYDYQPGRGQQYPEAYLNGFDGYLLTDGYAGYNGLKLVQRAGCWAHVRRKFHDAEKLQQNKTGKASQAIKFIQKLYGIEQGLKKCEPGQRQRQRQEKAGPILEAFHQWLTEIQPTLTPKSQLGVAVTYALNQWSYLQCYLNSGEIGIDNNVTERDIRPFTTGRKNWLFSQSTNGAKASAALYSIVMTCRANDINPYYYFERLFTELPLREEGADLSDLLPWNIELNTE